MNFANVRHISSLYWDTNRKCFSKVCNFLPDLQFWYTISSANKRMMRAIRDLLQTFATWCKKIEANSFTFISSQLQSRFSFWGEVKKNLRHKNPNGERFLSKQRLLLCVPFFSITIAGAWLKYSVLKRKLGLSLPALVMASFNIASH